MLANSKLFRQLESRALNPEYKFTAETEEFSLGEVAAPVIAFGSLESGEVSRTLVTYFFGKCALSSGSLISTLIQIVENERLPNELGWHKKNATVTLRDILNTVTLIRNATDLITPEELTSAFRQRDMHAGMVIQKRHQESSD
jgi:hypothetical protein